MLMEWVNHASFIIRSGSVSLLCDPWLEGTAFNEGWSLLSPSKFSYNDFTSISHIWFSHEYPDHFNPPNLRQIPQEYRQRIKVLFQYTENKRVIDLCRTLGFKTLELPEWEEVEISPEFKVMSGMQGLMNSWIAVFAEGKTILNMNDCVFQRKREIEEIRQKVGKIDVLLSQFSYATWVGNPEDHARHKKSAENKIAKMCEQIQVLEPGQFIPFASYVFFSHAENVYMNSCSNRVGEVSDYLVRELSVPTIVLYPGDQWVVGTAHDSTESIRRYNQDFSRSTEAIPTRAEPVSWERLNEAAGSFVSKFSERNSHLLINALPPAVIYLPDLDSHLQLSIYSGLRIVETCQPDIMISSDSLLDCLTTDWGAETLIINGRFRVPSGGRPRRFFWIFQIPGHHSTTLDLRFLGRRVVGRARAGVGRR